MTTKNVTIEQLAQKLGYSVWSKDDLKRIYLNDEGYNTKKMSTKTFIFEKDGEFIVSCRIECPSQGYQWIDSQEQEVKDSVYSRIERIIDELTSEFVYAVVKNNEYYYEIDNVFGLDLWQMDDSTKIYSQVKAEEIAKEIGGEVFQYSKEEFQAMIDKAGSELDAKRTAEILSLPVVSIAQPVIETKPEPCEFINSFEIGEKYNHSKWGIVIAVAEDENTVTVNYNGENKKLLKRFAPLQKV